MTLTTCVWSDRGTHTELYQSRTDRICDTAAKSGTQCGSTPVKALLKWHPRSIISAINSSFWSLLALFFLNSDSTSLPPAACDLSQALSAACLLCCSQIILIGALLPLGSSSFVVFNTIVCITATLRFQVQRSPTLPKEVE